MVIGICDDEIEYRRTMREYCERYASENSEDFRYKEFKDGEEVLKCSDNIDILLLDVELGQLNGIDIMKRLEECGNVRNILFMSNHDDYVFDSHGNKTRGYIRKSKGYANFEKYMKSTIAQMEERVAKRFVKAYVKREYIYIDTRKIVYVYADKRYCEIYTEEEQYLVCENLSVWEEKLNEFDIKRVHNSYLVNFDYVKSLSLKGVVLNIDGPVIPMGRRYYDTRKKEFDLYRIKWIRENGK